MWYLTENGTASKPSVLDINSSKVYNYVRKDFEFVEETEEHPAHWQWMEAKILKKDWDIFSKVMDHDNALTDVYDALTELAEMVVG